MEQLDNEQGPKKVISRRTIVKGAAWSLPVVAAAVAVPAHAASNGVVINPSAQPVPTGVCTPLGNISFTITNNGAPVAGQAIIVTLPPAAPAGQSSFHWDDNTTGPKTFTSDANGVVDLTNHIVTSSTPGTYTVLGQVAPNGATSSIQVMVSGMWMSGLQQGYGGTGIHGVYNSTPADPSNPGTPDYYSYCVEHNVSAKSNMAATAGGLSTFLGSNYLTGSADIYSKVLWIIQNSYPGITLSAFSATVQAASAAANPARPFTAPLSANDAIEATQYAIWRYTDLDFDASWNFQTPNSEAAYWYLIDQINAGQRGTQSGTTGLITAEATTVCGSPTGGSHAQCQILVVPA
ncbi:Cys-Gln thioester bond-forming surface protein [Microbacterium sp. Au-Mic1]|uniref:Cys-Gln thioester bond-forming surface protein n=1 Tax=Microbacterium sp. Au-Mic1 TaxID=2906457 RepID=UPI001E395D73|nr:Cys-Gln thioester bond-forming surface protein [Microbacterium sp. Au-Mic1]MCE4027824.1 Cys-Gln thioester bond-forming surface protein [Microbacterium sp. Au-Mic1]